MSSSRESILANIKNNQPDFIPLPSLSQLGTENYEVIEKFTAVLGSISGQVVHVNNYEDILDFIKHHHTDNARITSTIAELNPQNQKDWQKVDPHELYDVDFTVFKGKIGVAENGAIWLEEKDLGQRVAPFITQYLAIVLEKNAIVPTLHQAYEQIGQAEYGFGVFIAGPSKTADIEQSLILGAHGARGLVVFLI
jgi:L-lactate dehydrogenase complex protein LldG